VGAAPPRCWCSAELCQRGWARQDLIRVPERQVDSIPLSRPKRSIARDFADGGAAPPPEVRAPGVAAGES